MIVGQNLNRTKLSGAVELFSSIYLELNQLNELDRRLSVGCLCFFWPDSVNLACEVRPEVNASEGSRNLHYAVLCVGKQLYS